MKKAIRNEEERINIISRGRLIEHQIKLNLKDLINIVTLDTQYFHYVAHDGKNRSCFFMRVLTKATNPTQIDQIMDYLSDLYGLIRLEQKTTNIYDLYFNRKGTK